MKKTIEDEQSRLHWLTLDELKAEYSDKFGAELGYPTEEKMRADLLEINEMEVDA